MRYAHSWWVSSGSCEDDLLLVVFLCTRCPPYRMQWFPQASLPWLRSQNVPLLKALDWGGPDKSALLIKAPAAALQSLHAGSRATHRRQLPGLICSLPLCILPSQARDYQRERTSAPEPRPPLFSIPVLKHTQKNVSTENAQSWLKM